MVRLRGLLQGLVVILALASADAMGQTATEVCNPSFKTLQTKVNGNDQLPPVITMGSDDILTVSFDELAAERRYMRYELIHCDAGWRKDSLLPSDYIDGFNEATIDDYAMSRATLVQYVHYCLEIPNPAMRVKLSGNYLLRVYDEALPEETLLQVRFSVMEPIMDVKGSVTSRTDIDYNRNHQQLSVEVNGKGMAANSLMNDLTVIVSQNGRMDNMAVLTNPSRLAGSTAIWEHDKRLIFPAGNEYRRMETVAETGPLMHVEEIVFVDPYYQFFLTVDEPRADSPYEFDSTQKGRFRIRRMGVTDSDTEAEYVMFSFTLDSPEIPDGDIFLDGDFTLRRFTPESLMVFNRATGRYEASMVLKQGAYNYGYLAVKHGSVKGNTATIEGDKYQTANEYLIMVYYREPGTRYDRLVAVTTVTAGI